MTPDQYAQAVRDAVGEHPDREELLEDLDDHLAEIAAESDLPLEDRLGPPAAYAEELMAAYGGRTESRQKRRARPREWVQRAHAALLRQGSYRGFMAFLPELRPGWWVLRGYLLAMLLLTVADSGRLAPQGLVDWALVVAAVCASVWFGRRRRGRVLVLLASLANVAGALALFIGLVAASSWNTGRSGAIAMSEPEQSVYVSPASAFNEVYNIKPYAKDGTPLTDVYLYDQDGKPVITNPENYGYSVDRACGEPILNRYPLPLVDTDVAVPEETPSAPRACPTATPSPSRSK
ncbi:hypothetical protein ACTMTI_21680 [Nonomuraea sp. H19]|uniref:hypothetical protein n=1 Tax=Nonomuraea sp. H19 TaxID=3452206 RepID=UPI003F8B254C